MRSGSKGLTERSSGAVTCSRISLWEELREVEMVESGDLSLGQSRIFLFTLNSEGLKLWCM